MPNSPKKARKTYTRRTVQQKFGDALEELKTLITRHCGTTELLVEKAAKEAAEQTVARLTPNLAAASSPEPLTLAPSTPALPFGPFGGVKTPLAASTVGIDKAAALKALAKAKVAVKTTPDQRAVGPPVTIAKPKKLTCPGGPALYNKFIITTSKKLKDMGIELPYQEIKDLAGEYWKKIKTDICFNDENGNLLDQFSEKAAESIAAGASNTTNYNNLVSRTKALRIPTANSNTNGATRKLVKGPRVVRGNNAAANFVKKAALPNVNFSTIQLGKKPAASRKVRVQAPTNKAPVTPGRSTPPATAAPPRKLSSNYDPFENLFGNSGLGGGAAAAAAAPAFGGVKNTSSAGSNLYGNLLNLGPATKAAPPAPLGNKPVQTMKPAAPTSIAASMPTPTTNNAANNSVREVNIDGKKYFMNVATKGLYEQDENSGSFGPWVGYRQNNGSIRYTNAPEE